jgi:hypothetical protein
MTLARRSATVRTWAQNPRRHCGIPSRWEEGAPAPGAEPRLGPLLSQGRCLLFPLGAQFGKQGVFSVPLDPHAWCIQAEVARAMLCDLSA